MYRRSNLGVSIRERPPLISEVKTHGKMRVFRFELLMILVAMLLLLYLGVDHNFKDNLEYVHRDRYIVHCAKETFSHQYYAFGDYIHRDFTNPPDFHEYAVLVKTKDKDCKNTDYYKKSMERYRNSTKFSIEKFDLWENGVHWPQTAKLRSIVNRPLIIYSLGEVFWEDLYEDCESLEADVVFYRSKTSPRPDCPTIHFVQAKEFYPTLIPQEPVTLPPERFCIFVATLVFRRAMHDVDALVRHAFHSLLSEYKHCVRPKNCIGGPADSWKCMRGHKFAITMENTQTKGYVSEKIFSGLQANTIPIYFGAEDIGNYVNEERIVHCQIDRKVILNMRSYFEIKPGKTRKEREWTFEAGNPQPSDTELIDWAKRVLRPHLMPCIERVKQLDEDREMYMRVVNKPWFRDDQTHVWNGSKLLGTVEEMVSLMRRENE